MKIKETYSGLLDENKPLLPQLKGVKKSCFRPYISDLQLIRYECEKCSEEGKYSKCLFYEATHLSCFSKILEEIQQNNTIRRPKIFHPKAERLCYGRTSLETILKGAWPLVQHEAIEPDWIGTDEHRCWNKKYRRLQKDLPCESTCKMSEWCAFYQNGLERKLCVTTIKNLDDEHLYINTKYSTKMDKGYRVDSHLYKEFIRPSTIKELPPIKTDRGWKKLDDWHYSRYDIIYKMTVGRKKEKLIILKAVLDVLDCEDENILIDKMNQYRTFDYKKLRAMGQQGAHKLTDTADQFIEIDLEFWKEYVAQNHLEFSDLIYAYYLHKEKTPSRKELEERFMLPQIKQVEIERRLGIRKDFRNTSEKQISNKYITNPYIMDAIFQTLDRKRTEEKINEIRAKNKEKMKKEKIYNKQGQPKLSNHQLLELDELKQQLISK